MDNGRYSDTEKVLLKLKEITSDRFQNPEVRELDNFFFNNGEFIESFCTAIGGSEHHRYKGGLLRHTLNVTYWTSEICKLYGCDNEEIAVLAAKLHDIGKIYEYDINGNTTLQGSMEGHVVIGISMIENAFGNSSFSYSDDFKNRIKGCVVQHHGEECYGSPKKPNTQEAYILHHADYLDATMWKVENIKNRTVEGTWSQYSCIIDGKLYR